MPVIYKDGIKFDSELELLYYENLQCKYAKGEILDFIYHPMQIMQLVGKRSYTPDFIVIYKDIVEIVETKGFNPYSKRIDDAIHEVMNTKTEEWLRDYVSMNTRMIPEGASVVYKKYKYLKAYGFVEWDFKNPNTIANKRKEKIETQKDEIKELREFKKNQLRYLKYMNATKPLTKSQREWLHDYTENVIPRYLEEA